VAERADGLAVREDDAEPEMLEGESMTSGGGGDGGERAPLLWRTSADGQAPPSCCAHLRQLYVKTRPSTPASQLGSIFPVFPVISFPATATAAPRVSRLARRTLFGLFGSRSSWISALGSLGGRGLLLPEDI
jgi:hypothetical protein